MLQLEPVEPRDDLDRSGRVLDGRVEVFALCAAVLLGFAVRLRYVLASGFPLNDGGLFYVTIQALQRSHYALPAFVSYNGLRIPFAYPPLGFYAAALLTDFLHLGLFTVLRVVPLVMSTLSIGAFALLARAVLPSRQAAVAATFAFAALPMGFVWYIMGGGLTRSFGFLFAILALQQTHRALQRPTAARMVLAALPAALAVLSHPEESLFLATGAVVLFLTFVRSRQGMWMAFVLAAGIAVLTAPWWGTVLAAHGVAPFLAVARAVDSNPLDGVVALFLFGTYEPLFPIIGALALLGLVACCARKQYLLPLWLLAIPLVDPRNTTMHETVVFALLAGIGLAEVLVPLVGRLQAEGKIRRFRFHLPGLTIWVAEAPLAYAFLMAVVVPQATLGALTAADRDAMRWAAQQTPPASRFLIVAGLSPNPGGQRTWGADRVAEWFPVLAQRTSVITPQGREWIGTFAATVTNYGDAQLCAERDTSCLGDWLKKSGEDFNYLYIPKSTATDGGAASDGQNCCRLLRYSLRADSHYLVVFDGPGATIYERQPEGNATASDPA